MNFNYSYRAFLITSLLFGIFFLILYSVKLSSEEEVVYENYDVAYEDEPEEVLPAEELATVTAEQTEIETNRAYNEAEELLEELENTSEEFSEQSMEEKLAEIDAAIANSEVSSTAEGIEKAREKIEEAKQQIAEEKAQAKGGNTSSSRRTTISYRLIDRKALNLPNPVYTCEGGGKIVLSIEVDATGKITKATYNKGMSTTSNGCLIDSAMEYANRSRFTTKTGKAKQLGTITYNFPGQR